MCTGITFQASNGDVIFGRTMDYDYPLNGFPAVQPRGYSFKSHVDYEGETLYAFAGAGSDMEGFVFGDGVNEHGLAMSNQYDRGYASYATDIREGYINISQTEVLVWALGYNRTIEELIENAKQVNVVAYSYSDINEVPPLHYHLSDATVLTVEVTIVDCRIVVIDNPIGVLTNNPDLNWHYENLKHFMHVTPYNIDNTFSKQLNLGNTNGTFGLPGGYTSGERFVRAAYLVHHLLPNSDDHPILDAFRILDHVSVPKGAVRPSDNGFYYTLYQTVFNLTTKTLYIKYYDSNTITELQLTDDLINRDDLVVFSRKNKGLYTEKVND